MTPTEATMTSDLQALLERVEGATDRILRAADAIESLSRVDRGEGGGASRELSPPITGGDGALPVPSARRGVGSLEWLRSGELLYTLVQDGWRKGEPVLCNQFMVRVTFDRRYATDDEADSLANVLHDFLRDGVGGAPRPPVSADDRSGTQDTDLAVNPSNPSQQGGAG